MHTRQNTLNKWLANLFEGQSFTLTPITGDASFRNYLRLNCDDTSYIVMDAPPDKESILPFLDIARRLTIKNIHAPQVHAYEAQLGFILLEDFGDKQLLNVLTTVNADIYYESAMQILLSMQTCTTLEPSLPLFNQAFMLQELQLFQTWFLQQYLQLSLTQAQQQLLTDSFAWLVNEIANQPQVFIHRDYHSRNLMVISPGNLDMGVLDFQDAMIGPITYDLVSLLKDCYIQWPQERIRQWLSYFYNHLQNTQHLSFTAFTRAFDLCGLQRHLKVLGIFSRLYIRDDKPTYLQNLPRIFNYINDCFENHNMLKPFSQFMQQTVYLTYKERCKL